MVLILVCLLGNHMLRWNNIKTCLWMTTHRVSYGAEVEIQARNNSLNLNLLLKIITFLIVYEGDGDFNIALIK